MALVLALAWEWILIWIGLERLGFASVDFNLVILTFLSVILEKTKSIGKLERQQAGVFHQNQRSFTNDQT